MDRIENPVLLVSLLGGGHVMFSLPMYPRLYRSTKSCNDLDPGELVFHLLNPGVWHTIEASEQGGRKVGRYADCSQDVKKTSSGSFALPPLTCSRS